ncbi:MAG: nitroreductase [Bacteroidota bacterium]
MPRIVGRKKGSKEVQVKKAVIQQESYQLPAFDREQVDSLIKNRRSIFPKDYSGEIIPKEKIETLLEHAHWAPNHGKTEPWFFKVFTGEGLKKLADAQAAIYKELSGENFEEKKYNKLLKKPLMASHIIAICMKRGDNPKIPELEEIEAVSAAVQNLWLSATAMGLGGYWSSGGVTYKDEMRDWLGLGVEDKCLGFFYLGMPKEGWTKGSRQSDWQSKVEWVEG